MRLFSAILFCLLTRVLTFRQIGTAEAIDEEVCLSGWFGLTVSGSGLEDKIDSRLAIDEMAW